MSDPIILAAQSQREDAILEDFIDQRLDVIFSAKTVGPDARVKLRKLLAHYAKKPHPFRACVRDNMKRFGPGRTEAVCATLKDLIRGTTRWRNGGQGLAAADVPEIDQATETLLLSISDSDLEKIIQEAVHLAR